MEEHIGNIIYLIAVIIAVISSIVSKIRKTTAKDINSPASPQKSWQDVIREMTMEKKPSTTFDRDTELDHFPTQPQLKAVKVQSFLDAESDIHRDKKSVKASVAGTPKNTSIFEEPAVGKVVLPDFSNYEEIKRGVIFNEIFTRKF